MPVNCSQFFSFETRFIFLQMLCLWQDIPSLKFGKVGVSFRERSKAGIEMACRDWVELLGKPVLQLALTQIHSPLSRLESPGGLGEGLSSPENHKNICN